MPVTPDDSQKNKASVKPIFSDKFFLNISSPAELFPHRNNAAQQRLSEERKYQIQGKKCDALAMISQHKWDFLNLDHALPEKKMFIR